MRALASFQNIRIRAEVLADACLLRRCDNRALEIGDGDVEEPLDAAPCILEDLTGLLLEFSLRPRNLR